VVALTAGEMTPTPLWTLRRLAQTQHDVVVVHALRALRQSRAERFRYLAREFGVVATISRACGSLMVEPRDARSLAPLFDSLFDGAALARWWATRPLDMYEVPALNSEACRAVLTGLDADLLVRVTGGILKPATYSLARYGTINLHHGVAPAIRGLWSIPWGVVERRADWIGATIHQIDEGIDTGAVYRRITPQIAPGDTSATLLFRTHVAAVEALVGVIDTFAVGSPPPVLANDGASAYHTAPGLRAWARYFMSGRGRRSSMMIERALR
jgi:Formyl transferase